MTFITLEGGEGVGKSTQAVLLKAFLEKNGKEVLLTREPGGTEGAEDIRSLLVEGDKGRWLPKSELLLHVAARHEHVERIIKPALAEGKVVICDRFMDSTLAYQGYGHQLGREYVMHLQQLLFGDLAPDLTLIFTLDRASGLDRTKQRGNQENRYESMAAAFHDRVIAGFLDIAKHAPERCHLINAGQPIETVAKAVENAVRAYTRRDSVCLK